MLRILKLQIMFVGLFLIPADCLANRIPDSNRYITIDEIDPNMSAYCKTVYLGSQIEKFELDVISVIYNYRPGKNAILVKGTDPRFVHTGPVHGCSGSPVYIDGRIAGALAFGWNWSKDPLYGVTPIEEMLRVGREEYPKNQKQPALTFDFSQPINFSEATTKLLNLSRNHNAAGLQTLPVLLASSIPIENTPSNLNHLFRSLGFFPVSAPAATASKLRDMDNVVFEPGSTLAVPLVTGDVTLSAIGTVTDVQGNKVYGFGHDFLGYGPVDVPMAVGKIHTVVASRQDSWKLGQTGPIRGALRFDESTAVVGLTDQQAQTFPFSITVERYNDSEVRKFNCRAAFNKIYTPVALTWILAGASKMIGGLPPEHSIAYDVNIKLDDGRSIETTNISTGHKLDQLIDDTIGPVTLLLNNPYRKIKITSIDYRIKIEPENKSAHIWSVDVSDNTVKPGQAIRINAVVESYMSKKRQYCFDIRIPEDTQPGEYQLHICGPEYYRSYLKKSAPYQFLAEDIDTLIDSINNALSIKRNKLYCILELRPSGLTLHKAKLPHLPATKAMLLVNQKRALQVEPFQHWIEKSTDTDSVTKDQYSTKIKVEK